MADSTAQVENGPSTSNASSKPDSKPPKPSKPNPMWKYLGFGENFRPKLPSRNWSIFLAITGSFTTAVIYDKRETRRVQRKWCKLVEHVAKEPLDPRAMPRKLSIFLEAPPTDGLRSAQDHFKEYVKPVLVASGLDWEFIQGRREGDIRAELAETIRRNRLPLEQRLEEDPMADLRHKAGIKEFEGPNGDIVIGRNTWKEYLRGLHEGWLGPLTPPTKTDEERPQEELAPPIEAPTEILHQTTSSNPQVETITDALSQLDTPSASPDDASPQAQAQPEQPPKAEPPKDEEKPKKPPKPQPFISTSDYPTAPTPPIIPPQFSPSQPIPFPHILGFLNTPKRMYRFLNRRHLADAIGRETAAVILATSRSYNYDPSYTPPSSSHEDFPNESNIQEAGSSLQGEDVMKAEQATALSEEEKEWHKSIFARKEGEEERTWLEPVILDPRIASRMRRFELSAEDEERAKSIVIPETEVEGWIKGGLRSLGRGIWAWTGIGKEEKPFANVGDVDVDSQG